MNKKSKTLLVMSFAAFAASVYSLAAAAAYEPTAAAAVTETPRTAQTTISETTSPAFPPKILRLYNGQVAVFEEDADVPIQILPINIEALPQETLSRLKSGIYATTREEYLAYLEDFS